MHSEFHGQRKESINCYSRNQASRRSFKSKITVDLSGLTILISFGELMFLNCFISNNRFLLLRLVWIKLGLLLRISMASSVTRNFMIHTMSNVFENSRQKSLHSRVKEETPAYCRRFIHVLPARVSELFSYWQNSLSRQLKHYGAYRFAHQCLCGGR